MRILSPTIQLGQLLQAVTVCVAIGTGLVQAGRWVSDIRADLHTETQARIDHDNTLAVALADNLAHEATARRDDAESAIASRAQMVATLARIDRSFQHLFALTQPQPARPIKPGNP